MHMKDVVLLSTTAFLGGAERSLCELASALLRQSEFYPHLACPAGELAESAAEKGVHVIAIHAPRFERHASPAGKIAQLPAVVQCARQIAAAVRGLNAVAVHANGVKAGLVAGLACGMAKAPWILHVRDAVDSGIICRTVMASARRIIVPARFLKEEAVACRINGGKIRVLPHGIEPPALPLPEAVAALRSELGAGDDAAFVAMVGQVVPWKRQDLFLEAAAVVARSRPDVRFVLAGSDIWGRHSDYLGALHERARRADLAGKVVFLGQRGDVLTLLALSSVLAVPSVREPFGRIIVEGWHAGVCPVVANEGGPAELVGHEETGLVFAAGNRNEMAGAMLRLLDSGELRSRLAANGRLAAERLDVKHHAVDVACLYRELMN
jgi:glycosyltransferase involved in cell wall biosynthesis